MILFLFKVDTIDQTVHERHNEHGCFFPWANALGEQEAGEGRGGSSES